MLKTFGPFVSALFLLPLVTSCIDEDLSDCGRDYTIIYDVKLVTNVESELSTTLTTAEERDAAERLRRALGGIFVERAEDITLDLFTPDHRPAHHLADNIGGRHAEYTLYLPPRDYTAVAAANVALTPQVTLTGSDDDRRYTLEQSAADTVASHVAPLWTARTAMPAAEADRPRHDTLYMANCATALVIDPNGLEPTEIRTYTRGFAQSFTPGDSTYHHTHNPVVRTREVTLPRLRCYYSVNFPSPDNALRPLPAGNDDPTALWQWEAVVTLGSRTTRTVLSVRSPLSAACLKVIKAKLNPDGSLTPEAPEVGAGITIDWKPGGDHDIEI